jgi:hypothetical protein
VVRIEFINVSYKLCSWHAGTYGPVNATRSDAKCTNWCAPTQHARPDWATRNDAADDAKHALWGRCRRWLTHADTDARTSSTF